MQADLFAANVDFHDDLVRNIPDTRQSQHLFDDLPDDPGDWNIAVAVERAEGMRPPQRRTADRSTTAR